MQGSEQDLFDRYLQADTLALAEAGVRALADIVLPQSAKQQVETFFCQFRDRGGKIAEDGAMTGCADFFFLARVLLCVTLLLFQAARAGFDAKPALVPSLHGVPARPRLAHPI
jgi:hypothetical protein